MDVPGEKLDDLLTEPLLGKHTPVPDPFQRGTVARIGMGFYSLALTEMKARAVRMLRWLRDSMDMPDDVSQLKIHYSGCTVDCGQANTAGIGLFGMCIQKDGEMVEAMDVGVGGGVDEEPLFVDWIQQRTLADEVPSAIVSLMEAFAECRDPGRTPREWVDAEGIEAVTEHCVPEETEFEMPYMHDAKQSWYPFAEDEAQSEQAVMSDRV